MKTFTPRTTEEILAKIADESTADMFGTQRTDLALFLPFEQAKPFFKDGMTAEEFASYQVPNTKEGITKEIVKYLPFAWGKANDERSLSAARSLLHFTVWVWMLGDDLGNLLDYCDYGKPHLITISEKYGFDHDAFNAED
jgi:hypothetical protein